MRGMCCDVREEGCAIRKARKSLREKSSLSLSLSPSFPSLPPSLLPPSLPLPPSRYSNGDVYSGHWLRGQRCGFGRLEEASRKDSYYTGAWEAGKRSGYGVYEDKMK